MAGGGRNPNAAIAIKPIAIGSCTKTKKKNQGGENTTDDAGEGFRLRFEIRDRDGGEKVNGLGMGGTGPTQSAFERES